MTQREKADRYDSLQLAFRFERDVLAERIKELRAKEVANSLSLGAYNMGRADGFESVLKDIERWII